MCPENGWAWKIISQIPVRDLIGVARPNFPFPDKKNLDFAFQIFDFVVMIF